MAFGRRNMEEVPTEKTMVWECTIEGCNAWIRDNFKSSDVPACPICTGKMRQATRDIQPVQNTGKRYI